MGGGGEEKQCRRTFQEDEKRGKRKRTHVALGKGGASCAFHCCQKHWRRREGCEAVRMPPSGAKAGEREEAEKNYERQKGHPVVVVETLLLPT
jgi:hypothetical protein